MNQHISPKSYFHLYGKSIFWSFFLCVFCFHGYAMANLTGNNDTMGIISGYAGAGTSSGRWFLDILVKICRLLFGNVYFLPWFNLLTGFFFIACSAFLILYMLQIRSKAAVVFVTALMLVFPATTSMALYGYTFHFNMFSLLLAVSAAVLCVKETVPFCLLASLFLSLSLGIYQAYLPFSCAIMILFWIKMLVNGHSSQKVVRSVIFCGATVLLGLILYFIFTKFFCSLFHVSLSSYKGINQMTNIPSLGKLCLSAVYSYGLLLVLPLKNFYGLSTPPILRIFILIYYVLALVAVIRLYKKTPSVLSGKILLSLLLLLLPLAANLIFFMVGGDKSMVYAAMLYGTVAIFLFLPLFFSETICSSIQKHTVFFIMGIMVLLWGWYSNGVYRTSHHVIEQNITVWNRIITKIESLEGYRTEMPLYIIGDQPDLPSVSDNYGMDFGQLVSLDYVCGWALPGFLKNYMGWNGSLTSVGPELPPEFPVYPDEGSIQIIDDVVVIRFE